MRLHLTPSRNNAKFWDFVGNFEIEIEGETLKFYDYAKTLFPGDFESVTVAGYEYTPESILRDLVAANGECVLGFSNYSQFSDKFWQLLPIAAGEYVEKLKALAGVYARAVSGQTEEVTRTVGETAARSNAGLSEGRTTNTAPNVETVDTSRVDSHAFERSAGNRTENEEHWRFSRADIFGVFEMAEEARYSFLTAFDSLFQTLILI